MDDTQKKFQNLAVIILTEDLPPDSQMKKGTLGTILEQSLADPNLYLVEFADNNGKTIEMLSVHANNFELHKSV